MKPFDPDAAPALQRRFLLMVVAAISALFLWMIGGFLMALLLAAITAAHDEPELIRSTQRFVRIEDPGYFEFVLSRFRRRSSRR